MLPTARQARVTDDDRALAKNAGLDIEGRVGLARWPLQDCKL